MSFTGTGTDVTQSNVALTNAITAVATLNAGVDSRFSSVAHGMSVGDIVEHASDMGDYAGDWEVSAVATDTYDIIDQGCTFTATDAGTGAVGDNEVSLLTHLDTITAQIVAGDDHMTMSDSTAGIERAVFVNGTLRLHDVAMHSIRFQMGSNGVLQFGREDPVTLTPTRGCFLVCGSTGGTNEAIGTVGVVRMFDTKWVLAAGARTDFGDWQGAVDFTVNGCTIQNVDPTPVSTFYATDCKVRGKGLTLINMSRSFMNANSPDIQGPVIIEDAYAAGIASASRDSLLLRDFNIVNSGLRDAQTKWYVSFVRGNIEMLAAQMFWNTNSADRRSNPHFKKAFALNVRVTDDTATALTGARVYVEDEAPAYTESGDSEITGSASGLTGSLSETTESDGELLTNEILTRKWSILFDDDTTTTGGSDSWTAINPVNGTNHGPHFLLFGSYGKVINASTFPVGGMRDYGNFNTPETIVLADNLSIVQATKATVSAYTQLDNLDELYDFYNADIIDNPENYRVHFLTSAGGAIDLIDWNLVVDAGAAARLAAVVGTKVLTVDGPAAGGLQATANKNAIITTGDITFEDEIGDDIILTATNVNWNAPADLSGATINGDLRIDNGATNTVLDFDNVVVTGSVQNDGTGTLTINGSNGTSFGSVVDPGTAAGQTDVINAVATTIEGIPSLAEWRLYEDSGVLGELGTVELDGEENKTGGAADKIYIDNYVSDTAVILQVIATGFEEFQDSFSLRSTPQTRTVVMVPETNT